MSIALDIGASRFRSLRTENDRAVARSSRALHAIIPDSVARRSILDRLSIPFSICDGWLLLTGDAACDYAALFQAAATPLLPEGLLPASNPPARQIIASLIERLLPNAKRPDEVCCLTIPGRGVDRPRGVDEEHEFFTRMVRLRGYRPIVMSAGLAVILAELVQESFTGIGISLGAATSEFCLALNGIEVATARIPFGGSWIDMRIAEDNEQYAWDLLGNRYVYIDDVSRWKESLSGSIAQPQDDREYRLTELYRHVIGMLLQEAAIAIRESPRARTMSSPLTIVCTGGMVRVPGFGTLMQQMLPVASFPLKTQKIRVVADSEYTVARGALISAEFESGGFASRHPTAA